MVSLRDGLKPGAAQFLLSCAPALEHCYSSISIIHDFQ